MNVVCYEREFDEATWTLLGHIGLTPSYLRAHRRAMAAVQQETSYKRELLAGDVITIHSAVLEMGEKVIRFYQEMRNFETNEVAAMTMLTGGILIPTGAKHARFPKRSSSAEVD